jgi:calcineurin-like phosphoesterase family protein
MIFFTSDYHLGHDMIIVHCNRPFRTVREMDRVITRNHNSVVSPDDIVYMAGDFSMYGPTHKGILRKYCKKLNGRIHLILGNHDLKDARTLVDDVGFFSVHYPYLEVEEFVVVHDPALSQVDRSRTFLGGHIHDLFKTMKNFINVGVDVRDFKPVSIDQVRELEKEMKTREGGWA